MTDRVSDAAIHAAVAVSLRAELVGPPADQGHARTTAIQLLGLTEYAAARGADPADARLQELTAALEALAHNELVAPLWPGEAYAVAARAALVAAIGRDDEEATSVRAGLRPLLVGHLDDELTTTTPLIDAFRGKVRDG